MPNESYDICHRQFHGPNCYNYHLQRRNNNKTRSVCEMIRKCPNCRHIYKLPDKDKKVCVGHPLKKPHKCGWGTCPNSKKKVDMTEHRCFIQRLPKQKDGPRYNRVTIDKVNSRPFKLTKDPNVVEVLKDPPLQVYTHPRVFRDGQER